MLSILVNKENSGIDFIGKFCYLLVIKDLDEFKELMILEDFMIEMILDVLNKLINEENNGIDFVDKFCYLLMFRYLDEFKELLVLEDYLIKIILDVLIKFVIFKEEEILFLFLKMVLKLDIENLRDFEERMICEVRLIFVKCGKGVNFLERLFIFIVIIKEELKYDKFRKLWR